MRKVPTVNDIDFNAAANFLKLLDPRETNWTFQTFTDSPLNRPKPDPLAKIIHGSLANVQHQLKDLNKQGAGIYVMVNKGDGRGRKKANVTGVRTLWQEADRPNCPSLPAGYTGIEVETSPGKYHRYPLVDGLAPVDEFNPTEARLVQDYGSDPDAIDVSRVLRVPGFLHLKNPAAPWLVRLTNKGDGKRHSWKTLQRVFPPVPVATAAKDSSWQPTGGSKIVPLGLLRAALGCIDPDENYLDWILIGMALHNECAGGSEGLEMWDRWSRGDWWREKDRPLYSPGECSYRWRTFGQSGGTKNVTIKYIYKLAFDAGWNNEYMVRDTVNDITKTTTPSSHDDDAKLIIQERERLMEQFNREHALLIVKGRHFVVTGALDETERMNPVFEFNSMQAMVEKYRSLPLPHIERLPTGSYKVSKTSMLNVWRNYAGRRIYNGVIFQPEAGMVADRENYRQLPPPTRGGKLNMYRGLAVTPAKGSKVELIEKAEPILWHIFEVMCGGDVESFNYFMNWLARLYQKPNEQASTVPAFRSIEGTGKTIIIERLLQSFGVHGLPITRAKDLTGDFTAHLVKCVLVNLNEAVWGGDKQAEGVLKSLITDRQLFCNEKFVPGYKIDNFIHLIISSNNDWVAPVGVTDRRYVYFSVSSARVGDWNYFEELAGALDGGGLEALIGYLLQRDVSKFNPRALPKSVDVEKAGDKTRSMGTVEQWLYDVIDNGRFSYVPDEYGRPLGMLGELDSSDPGERTIQKEMLHRSYVGWCKAMGKRGVVSKVALFMKIRKVTPLKDVRSADPARKRMVVLRSQYELMCDFEKHLGHKLNWSCPTLDEPIRVEDVL